METATPKIVVRTIEIDEFIIRDHNLWKKPVELIDWKKGEHLFDLEFVQNGMTGKIGVLAANNVMVVCTTEIGLVRQPQTETAWDHQQTQGPVTPRTAVS